MIKDNVLVLIPAYKPDNKLIILLKTLSENYKVLVVDDGSGETYSSVFDAAKAFSTVIGYDTNKGKGGALKFGLSYIKDNYNVSTIVTADADGQHTMDDIEKVATSSQNEQTLSLTLGCRKFTGKVPFKSKFGNGITKAVFAVASERKLSDTQTGLRAFSFSLIDKMLEVAGNRYEYEMNVLMDFANQKIPFNEVEIKTVYENGNKGSHFNPIKDSFKIYKTIFLKSRSLKYIASSLGGFIVNYLTINISHFFLNRLQNPHALALATIIAFLLASQFNFWVNKKLVFKSDKFFVKAMGEYYLLATPGFLLKFVGLQALCNLIHFPLWIADIIVEIVIFILNYIIEKTVIFARKKKRKNES